MTEAEWNICRLPSQMLEFVFGKTSRRKYRLFACACCRLISEHLSDEDFRVVDAAERFADAELEEEELRAVWTMACNAGCEIATVAAVGSEASAWHVAHQAALETARMWVLASKGMWALSAAQSEQAVYLRDLSGPLLFRPAGACELVPTDSVRTLARALYAERRFDELPILADALEETGMGDPELLEHLRSAGPHVRGCWALDLVLGKS